MLFRQLELRPARLLGKQSLILAVDESTCWSKKRLTGGSSGGG